jgi:hypothetical protein
LNSGVGNYEISLFANADSALARTANDTISYPVAVTDTIYARDQMDPAGGSVVYYNPSVVQKYEVGVLYETFKIDTVSSISFFVPSANGRRTNKLGKLSAHIYRAGAWGSNGVQTLGTAPIFSSSTYNISQLNIPNPSTSAGTWVTFKVSHNSATLDTINPGKYVVTYQADQFFGSDTVFLALEGRDGWQSHYFLRQDQSGSWANWSYSTNMQYIRLNTKSESCPTLNGSVNATPTTACGLTNGTATAVDPTNGASPYTYYWIHNGTTNQTINNLAAGVYTVEIKDGNGCTMRASATVSDAGAPLITNDAVTNVVCAGDGLARVAFNLTPGSSGFKNYSFTWKDGLGNVLTGAGRRDSVLTGIGSGTYTVQISDGAPSPCIVSKSFSITGPKDTLKLLDPATTSTLNNPTCSGGTDGSVIMVTTGGTTPYIYTWADNSAITSGSRLSLAAGNYNVTVTDNNNCTATRSFSLTNPAALIASAAIGRNGANEVIFTGSSVNAQGGGATYTWSYNGAVKGTSNPFEPQEQGTYTMVCEDFNGCKATATWPGGGTSYEWAWTTGVSAVNASPEIKIYPNPTSGEFNVEFSAATQGVYNLSLKNVLGQELIQRQVEINNTGVEHFNVKEFNSGVYFLNVEYQNATSTFRVVVR